MIDFLLPLYPWIKALHVIAVISWMAGIFYLPRLFVYHTERADQVAGIGDVFIVMERKLLKVIMTPAMIVSWVCGLIMIGFGAFDFSAVWAWVKLLGVIGMTGMHLWLAARHRDFATGQNKLTGRQYRIANEVPTLLMFLIVIAVVVRPF